ncbi:hypothetical protein AVEN_109412-1 [Araneus ventricosus]|uniref:Uncharacterized protein n=1 Tax=Araneus ventricosus TaxID=182803 RepID=A0A4Y2PLQ6_ARAVE|nr:hypothetical protein AVEN_109412-1 [Araneus ventricosus]
MPHQGTVSSRTEAAAYKQVPPPDGTIMVAFKHHPMTGRIPVKRGSRISRSVGRTFHSTLTICRCGWSSTCITRRHCTNSKDPCAHCHTGQELIHY